MDYKAELLNIVPTMNGWCDPAKANHIFDTVYSRNPKVCVELGVFAGRSLIAFGLALAKRATKGSVVYGVDTWAPAPAVDNSDVTNASWWRNLDYKGIKRECETTCERLKLDKYVRLCQMSMVDAYSTIEGDIDVLHIDGNHSRFWVIQGCAADKTADASKSVDTKLQRHCMITLFKTSFLDASSILWQKRERFDFSSLLWTKVSST